MVLTNLIVDIKKQFSIPELNDLDLLKRYFQENDLFLFEVFSSKCPHCINLAPQLEKIYEEVF
jgi:hypothetical protein